MKNAMLAVGVIILSGIVAVAAASGVWIFWEAWKGADREAFRALLGGFCGAFFAFVFVRVGEGLKRLSERQERNHSGLVKLEHYLNNVLGVTGDNTFVVEDYAKLVSEERLKGSALIIYMNRFDAYDIDRQVLLDLTNIDFVNDVYSLNGDLRKLNGSMAATDKALDMAQELRLTDKIPHAAYVDSLRQGREKRNELAGFLEQTSREVVRLMGLTHYQLKNPPFFVWMLRGLTRRKYSKAMLEALPAEIAEVQKGIDEVAAASQKRIDAAMERKVPATQSSTPAAS